MAARLVLALVTSVAIGLAFAGPGVWAGPPECIDPSPNGGGEPPFEGFGTPNHTIVAKGDLCPGVTDEWVFSTLGIGLEEFIGIRVSARSGNVSIHVELRTPSIPYRPPFDLAPGEKYHAGAGTVSATYAVEVTGAGSGLAGYNLQVCRSINNPCQFGLVLNAGPGDANCSGAVDVYDAFDVLAFVAGLSATLDCSSAAQLDGDGRLTSRDSLLILQYVAGLIDELPEP